MLVFGDKLLKSVFDHIVVLSLKVQAIGDPAHLIPAILLGMRHRWTSPVRATPSLTLERARRIQIIAPWNLI